MNTKQLIKIYMALWDEPYYDTYQNLLNIFGHTEQGTIRFKEDCFNKAIELIKIKQNYEAIY